MPIKSNPCAVAPQFDDQIKAAIAKATQDHPKYAAKFAKAFTTKSLRTAINAKCLDCCCFTIAEIANCTVTVCPLWLVRPYQPKKGKENG